MNPLRSISTALAVTFGLALAGCSKPTPPPAAAKPVETKNGVPLTAEQIRERDAYIARAAAKKRQREQDELKRAGAIAFAAQMQALDFQRRQGAKLARQEQAHQAAQARAAALQEPAYQVAPPQEPKFRVVEGWDGSAPTGERRPEVVETYHRNEVAAEDPNNYVPPAAYQNLPPGSGGTRVVQPDYGSSGRAYTYRRPRYSNSYGGGIGAGYGGGFVGGYRGLGPEWDGRTKSQHVRGHFREGRWINSYNRRPARR